MSHSSTLSKQVEDLKEWGVPVKTGVPAFRGNQPTKEAALAASDLWLHRWAKHACQNYQNIHRAEGIRFLTNACLGLPAFVVGIGPSLDDHLPELKQAEGRGIIIATDAAFKPLLANQIKPDIVISFDCKAEQKTLWEDIPEHGIACLFDSCAHPEAIKSWGGPVLFYNHWHQQDEFSAKLLPYIFPHIGQLPSAGTVGNMGILAAKLMGCDPVFCIGMDFCYREKNGGWRYRATDYKIGEEGWAERENVTLYDNDERVRRSFEIEKDGKKWRIDPELEIYFNAANRIVKEFSVNAINLSETSRLASIWPTETLAQAIHKYCQSPYARGRTILPFLGNVLGRVK